MSTLIYHSLGVSVGESDAKVIERLRAKMRREAVGTSAEKALTAAVLREHHDAQQLYEDVMGARI